MGVALADNFNPHNDVDDTYACGANPQGSSSTVSTAQCGTMPRSHKYISGNYNPRRPSASPIMDIG